MFCNGIILLPVAEGYRDRETHMAMVQITGVPGGIEGERMAVCECKPNQYWCHIERFHLVDILKARFVGRRGLRRSIIKALQIATFHTLILCHTIHELIQVVIKLLLI